MADLVGRCMKRIQSQHAYTYENHRNNNARMQGEDIVTLRRKYQSNIYLRLIKMLSNVLGVSKLTP